MTDMTPRRMTTRRRREVSYDDARIERRAASPEDVYDEDRSNKRLLRALADATDAALGRLTDRQRQAIMLYYFEGLSQAEIAERWQVGRSAVCRILQRAYARLRSLIIVR